MSKRKKALIFSTLLLSAVALAQNPGVIKKPAEIIRGVWSQLGSTQNSCKGEFDYHPNGGPRIFACHLWSKLSFQEFSKMAGVPIFLSGPHSSAGLDLKDSKNFGRYNPAFVRWAIDNLIPGAEDKAFKLATQPLYEKFIRPLAISFFVTYKKIQREPACFDREVKRYQEYLAGIIKEQPYEQYFFVMNDSFCLNPQGSFDYFHKRGFDGGHNGNVDKSTFSWWIRRSLDGTKELWFKGLEKLLQTYDQKLLSAYSKEAPKTLKPTEQIPKPLTPSKSKL